MASAKVAVIKLPVLPAYEGCEKLTVLESRSKSHEDINAILKYSSLVELNLSFNNIETFPQLTLSQLTLMSIEHNPLFSVTPLCYATAMKELNISQCKFEKLPKHFTQLQSLTKLICHTNNMVTIHHIKNSNKLADIDFRHNFFTIIPCAVSYCTNLTTINFSDNEICSGLEFLSTLKELVELDLSFNKIDDFSPLCSLPKLTYLNLANNIIKSVSDEITGMVSLKELLISENPPLSSISPLITTISSLKILKFDDCKGLTCLPDMSQMTGLGNVTASSCQLTEFPKLPPTCGFNFSNNQIATLSLPEGYKKDSLEVDYNKLSELDVLEKYSISRAIVGNNKLTALRVNTALLTLNVSYNPLSALPQNMNTLTKLRQFSCNGCQLRKIDPLIFVNTKNLEILECGFNMLREIEFEDMPNLQQFYAPFNKLAFLPNGLFKSKKLRFVNVAFNDLEELKIKKDDRKIVSQLFQIDASYNNIRELSVGVDSLNELNISHNSLSFDDKDIANLCLLTGMKNIYATGYKIKKFPEVKSEAYITFSIYSSEKGSPVVECKKKLNVKNLVNAVEPTQENIDIGTFGTCGRRSSMQDNDLTYKSAFGTKGHFIGLFDGHGGDKGSYYFGKKIAEQIVLYRRVINESEFIQIMEGCIKETNKQLTAEKLTDGTTAVAVVVYDDVYYIMNIGDSRCVVVQDSNVDRVLECKEMREKMAKAQTAKTKEGKTISPVENVKDVYTSFSKIVSQESKDKSSSKSSSKSWDEDDDEDDDVDKSDREPHKKNLSLVSKIRKLGQSQGAAVTRHSIVKKSMCQIEEDTQVVGKALTVDHKPIMPEERLRVKKEGNYVTDSGKLNGYIGVSRAIGDVHCEGMVSCVPDYFTVKRGPTDRFLVLACDGVWDVMSNQEVALLCVANQNMACSEIAKIIVEIAYSRQSGDNITCIVFRIN
ncbi:protein phosphatase 2C, putative [Entamoeba invadens IP1]|uniref:Protein phosphatase 2C, putative n=1 Tax=Entamoeba invadens IP1 TaxID=370355 RepID=A0A0A1UGQ8_ENTIV|nr:protein phosphatase 2C, putative [Entamoeba invadens IP1]ELP92938.1 protein phosphatase 2C, putative [Entamoeba invadens IP1]|eukprot:XP_004259709.1 protein phosphatase 2C, putative [Entamoeba invadens IP1]